MKLSQARKYWDFDGLDGWRYEVVWTPDDRMLSVFYLQPDSRQWEFGHSKYVMPRTDLEVAVSAMRRFVTGVIDWDTYQRVLP